jgi:hypothetical protein
MTTAQQQIHLENAHASLVQAAKIAHLNKHQDAKEISEMIDSLEAMMLPAAMEKLCSKLNIDLSEETH